MPIMTVSLLYRVRKVVSDVTVKALKEVILPQNYLMFYILLHFRK